MTFTGWESLPAPMVSSDGRVPLQINAALSALGGHRAEDTRRRDVVQTFLATTCAELAESRAQVIADRAELDRLRAQVDRDEAHRLEAERRRTLGGIAPATTTTWTNKTSVGGVL